MAEFTPFERKMSNEHLPDIVIRTFKHYYEQLVAGATGMLPEDTIEPVEAEDVTQYDSIRSLRGDGFTALGATVVIKLNGGLGTSMGLNTAKSLIEVKDGLSFLDCTARQVQTLRREHEAGIPFVLMNSFATDRDTLAHLERYPDLETDVPLRFLQHRFPKVIADDLSPASWPTEPALEWNPPGHGDIYTALVTSGMLQSLRDHGYRYAFISNSDNLGATLEPAILGHFVHTDFAFLMEVAVRTAMDRKGGHLARRPNGGFVLRESAQCPEQDMDTFQDTTRHRYFNTNNLWLNLEHLSHALEQCHNVLSLPLIVNPKRLDPRDASTPKVLQLETAMGAAISVFDSVGAIVVPRSRFLPVKKCNDLLNVRSDRYVIDKSYRIVAHPDTTASISIDLDPAHYSRLPDYEARFPSGPPSLRHCTSFAVKGDVRFGEGIVAKDSVRIENHQEAQAVIPDFSRLGGTLVVPAQ